LTEEQQRAVDRRGGSLLVRAGAGTGKTTVLVERFVRAATDDEAGVNSILAITFTEKAAAQLKTRVRERFVELGRRDLAREAESAWISTIHGFCARLLRTHALAAGIDPEYKVLDDLEAERVATDAFDRALEDFLEAGVRGAPEGGHPANSERGRLDMIAAYKPEEVARMVRTAYGWLRSRGEPPELPEAPEPTPGDEAEVLELAAQAALAGLGAAGGGVTVGRAIERLDRCLALLRRLGAGERIDEAVVGTLALGRGANALKTPVCDAYEEARSAYEKLCVAFREHRDRKLLRELLKLYDGHYERLKRERSGLDFEDLELLTRDLLKEDEALRARYAERFSHVMVDEFQDTNPLQNELLGLISEGNLFRVGDERQSIYGFRHADVRVFRDHAAGAEAAGEMEPLTVNFRSRPELLDAIGVVFGSVWDDYDALRPPAPAGLTAGVRPLESNPLKGSDPSVELQIVDRARNCWDGRFEDDEDFFGPTLRSATHWRAAEARLLAKRVDELTGEEGPFEYSDVVVLLRATTHMTWYERALEERGIPTYVLGGRGYWGQQQVADLRAYLAALANPRDGLALYNLLASPLVGVSLDGIALIGMRARRLKRDPWWALEQGFDADGDGSDGLGDALPPGDREVIAEFIERFRAERAAAPRVALETLTDRAVTGSGYDRAVLRLPAGDRRMANVRKLMRMAREYEADEGRDLRGFIDFVAERDLVEEREGQAPLEAEEVKAVRLMTIHRAKGLEFPVVCVADLGKEGREEEGRLRLTEKGELGLRLASLGGESVSSSELDRIKAEQKARAEEEERRIFYVAATRAERHLVLSGATDLGKWPAAEPLKEPMRWIRPALAPDLPGLQGARGESAVVLDGRELRVRTTVCSPTTVDGLLSPEDRVPAGSGLAMPHRHVALQDLTPAPLPAVAPPPRALPVSHLSYSGLERYKRCGYRFYLERVLGLGGDDGDVVAPPMPETGELPPMLRGSIVHELLERFDFARPAAPTAEVIEARLEAHGAPTAGAVVADLSAMVEGFAASGMRDRLASARRLRTELPFVYTLGGLLVNGVVDVYAEEAPGVLVVDYKSDPVEGLDLDAYCAQRYATQRLVYALAALRSGAERVEVAYLFLERPDEPITAVFEAADAGRLEDELSSLAAGVLEGTFVPSDEPHRGLCAGCPGRAALCSHDEEMTMRDLPTPA
jgi:ATP-dependent exoDNAse (exonuclease V) beta subunit